MTLTPSEIEDRFEEAALTLRRLPEKDKPRGYGNSWPPIVQEAKDAYGYTPGRLMRVTPSPAAITRMEQCFDWLLMLDPEDARIVWLRAENVRWRQICIRAGCVRSTAWRRWAAALLTISRKLNSQAKSTAKARSAKAGAEMTGDRPRETGANTQDNPQDALNLGRDSCNTSGAQKA